MAPVAVVGPGVVGLAQLVPETAIPGNEVPGRRATADLAVAHAKDEGGSFAGGNELGGVYRDSHAGPCPDAVWDLLALVVPRASRLRAITFEFHDSYYPLLGYAGIADQLGRARAIWAEHG